LLNMFSGNPPSDNINEFTKWGIYIEDLTYIICIN
jgi:hypothetical protein